MLVGLSVLLSVGSSFLNTAVIAVYFRISGNCPLFLQLLKIVVSLLDYTCMEADRHIFLINLVYRLFRFDIPSISLDILGISFPMSLPLFEKHGITTTNLLDLVFCTINLV